MANLLNAERVWVAYGTRTLMAGVSLGLGDGEAVGVVGRNGDGKSTLLRILTGRREPDSGRVVRTGTLSIGYLDQEDDIEPRDSVRGVIVAGRADHSWAADPGTRAVVENLLHGVDLDTAVGTLSGGERRRTALAAVLLGDHELVVLDEPTNHLDVEAVAWLAEHLRLLQSRGVAMIVVSHDRWFLDAVCTRIWEVHDGTVDAYDGGYFAYVLTRAEKARQEAGVAARRRNLLRKELAWLRRGPPARTSKPKFRIDAANALIADEPAPRNGVELASFASRRLGKDVLDLEDASVSVGDPPHERCLLDRVTWRLAPGERIGIVGVNGSGKSTLLRALTGEIPLDGGRRKIGKTVAIAHLTQEVRELERFEQWRVIEAIEDVRQWTTLGGKEISAGQLATRLGFPGGRQQSRVGDLSGGERRRLQLTRLLLTEPNVLILDEPTNDLDLLERVADKQLALLGDGKVRDLPGGVEEYLRLRSADIARQAARTASSATSSTAAAGAEASGRPAGIPAGASSPATSASPAEVREARKSMARIEKQLSRLSDREERLHGEMAEKATDPAALADLNAKLQAVVTERDELELEWLEAAEIV